MSFKYLFYDNYSERICDQLCLECCRECSWISFNSHNFSIVDPMSNILWFSESLERNILCFNQKFRWDQNLSFFGLGPWAIHGVAKLANNFIAQVGTLMVPFEASLFKVSENQKIIEIGSTKFKLWQLKESPNHWLNSVMAAKPSIKMGGGGRCCWTV